MEFPDYLAHMAALIRENPSITVREIARELQFADSKSVYYWLDKSNIQGLNEFKRMILGDQDQLHEGLSLVQNGETLYLARIPLYSWDPAKRKPLGEWCFLHVHPNPRGIFAIQVGNDSFYPWFLQGDILIVDEEQTSPHSKWVLVKSGEGLLLGRTTADHQILDPRTLDSYPRSCRSMGTIVRLQREV